jgi:hypothetical protein
MVEALQCLVTNEGKHCILKALAEQTQERKSRGRASWISKCRMLGSREQACWLKAWVLKPQQVCVCVCVCVWGGGGALPRGFHGDGITPWMAKSLGSSLSFPVAWAI